MANRILEKCRQPFLAGTGASDAATGPYDSLERLTSEKWDAAALTKSRTYLPRSNLLSVTSTMLTATSTNVCSLQSMSRQGTLLAGYDVTSKWEGGRGRAARAEVVLE
jgi:hypothetical protein